MYFSSTKEFIYQISDFFLQNTDAVYKNILLSDFLCFLFHTMSSVFCSQTDSCDFKPVLDLTMC